MALAASEKKDISQSIEKSPDFRDLLKNKDFMLLWTAQILSQIIQNAVNFALAVLINRQTGSALMGGLILVLFSLPSAFLGPLPGILVDRWGQRKCLWWTNLIRAGIMALFGLSLLVMHTQAQVVIAAYVLTVIISLVGLFFMPAEGSAISMLVPKEQLVHALSLFTITFTLSQGLGLLVVGPIIKHLFGWVQLFELSGGVYFICALTIMLISRHPFQINTKPVEAVDVPSTFAMLKDDLLEGWQSVTGNRQSLDGLIKLTLASMVMLLVGEIAPNYVVKILHHPPEDLPILMAPAGITLALGAFVVPRVVSAWDKSRLAIVGLATIIIELLILAMLSIRDVNGLAITVCAMLVAASLGFSLDCVSIPSQAILQETVPKSALGRALALQQAIFNAASIPYIILTGILADNVGIYAGLCFGALVLGIGFLSNRRSG